MADGEREEQARLLADTFMQLARVTAAAATIEREVAKLREDSAKLALQIDQYLRRLMVEKVNTESMRRKEERDA